MNVTQKAYQSIVEHELDRHEQDGYRYQQKKRVDATIEYLVYSDTTKIGRILIGSSDPVGIACTSYANEVEPIFRSIREHARLWKIGKLQQSAGNDQSKQKHRQPKHPTTIAKWQRDWKRIEPLFSRGRDIKQIAVMLGMSRDTVSDIIAWATSKDT